MIEIERPFDLLNSLKDKAVIVRCKAYKEYDLSGLLVCFDIHINIVLEVYENKRKFHRFVRGENILFIEESN